MKKVATLVLVTLALSSTLAQSGTPISAEDILKVATAAVLDLSDVGRQVAVGVRRCSTMPRPIIAATATPPTSHRPWSKCGLSTRRPAPLIVSAPD